MAATADNGNVKLLFSDIFGVEPREVRRYGALDISLVSDLPLFIDPFLLFNSQKKRYQQLHRGIIRYLAFLRQMSHTTAPDSALVVAWYTFPEVSQTWLGFTRTGNRGRGLGIGFARALHGNLGRLFSNFGDEQITQGSHLEKLCLIEDGVGRDNISDFTTNLIKEYLLDYTQVFARKFIARSACKEIAVQKVRFNYNTRSWEPRSFVLPYVEGDYVILTPRDMLTKDNPWINRADLIEDFEAIPDSIPDAQLRAQVNAYFREMLPKEPKREDRQSAAVATIRQFPVLVDYYIRHKEEEGDSAVSISRDKVRVSEQLYLRQFSQLANLLHSSTGFYKVPGNTCDEARGRAQFLKDVVENKGGYRLFYVDGEPVRKEEDLHVAYRLTWFGTPSDVSTEVNDGRGPADFKVSRGAFDKAIVEFKLASNTKLKKNLAKQAEIYQEASDATCALKVIIFFTKVEQDRVYRILKQLGLDNDGDLFRFDIILIDARNDNKPSGSKAA